MTLTKEMPALQWSLPTGFEIPPDELKVRLDFYESTVLMFIVEGAVITTRRVSARDVAIALLSETPLSSGLLSPNTLWWEPNQVGLWEPPQVWSVALMTEVFKAPRRFRLPMPGLIFVCRPGQEPRVYAAKSRPRKIEETIYHAPLFNVFTNGMTCRGSHRYPLDVHDIPRSFFSSFFTREANPAGRSRKYPNDLLKLWEEINGLKKYPMHDLIPCGTMRNLVRPPVALPQEEAEENNHRETENGR